jgi:hypothetical protein
MMNKFLKCQSQYEDLKKMLKKKSSTQNSTLSSLRSLNLPGKTISQYSIDQTMIMMKLKRKKILKKRRKVNKLQKKTLSTRTFHFARFVG